MTEEKGIVNEEKGIVSPYLHDSVEVTPLDAVTSGAMFEFSNNDNWLIRILKEDEDGKIIFNHDAFPDYKPGDFAKEFIHILECSFTVKFIEKK